MKVNERAVKAFLKDLTKLSLKHGITIGGCGCCGSPWLMGHEKKLDGSYRVDGDNEALSFYGPEVP